MIFPDTVFCEDGVPLTRSVSFDLMRQISQNEEPEALIRIVSTTFHVQMPSLESMMTFLNEFDEEQARSSIGDHLEYIERHAPGRISARFPGMVELIRGDWNVNEEQEIQQNDWHSRKDVLFSMILSYTFEHSRKSLLCAKCCLQIEFLRTASQRYDKMNLCKVWGAKLMIILFYAFCTVRMPFYQ